MRLCVVRLHGVVACRTEEHESTDYEPGKHPSLLMDRLGLLH